MYYLCYLDIFILLGGFSDITLVIFEELKKNFWLFILNRIVLFI